MTIEKLANQIFAECKKDGEPITMEDAMEMAEMEIKAKGISNYTQSAEKPKEKKKTPKTVKVSGEKESLFALLWEGLYNFYGDNAEIVKNNKEINIKIGEKSFKIDIVEHRQKKN